MILNKNSYASHYLELQDNSCKIRCKIMQDTIIKIMQDHFYKILHKNLYVYRNHMSDPTLCLLIRDTLLFSILLFNFVINIIKIIIIIIMLLF